VAADVIVFVKAPRSGTVKTRLACTLGNETACDIYKALVASVLRTFSSFPSVQLRFSPDDALSDITPWLRPGWAAHPQGPGDLGQRMLRAFAHSFGRGMSKVIIIGSDCPEITLRDIDQASDALSSHGLVLGPATDGGYWLIGLTKSEPALFEEITWSSRHVLAETLARAAALGIRVHLLRSLSDIDTAEDWERCQCSKQAGTPAPN
jgi:uncharacterized protein